MSCKSPCSFGTTVLCSMVSKCDSRDAKLELSWFNHEFLQDDLFIDSKIFSSSCSIFYDLYDKSKGKFVKHCDYFLPFLDIFMKNLDGFNLCFLRMVKFNILVMRKKAFNCWGIF